MTVFALCDQRSFYASCEAVFRPDIRDKPIAVLSNNDGCVVALNTHAKKVGVEKFAPYFKQQALMKAKGVHTFSSNYALYGEISARIMATLRRLTPAMEVYSIDEGFCDLSGISADQLKPLAETLRDTVWREQRIPMGVSVAPTKSLAKLGQTATKTWPQINGVAVLEKAEQWEWLAKRVSVSEVWGVGGAMTRKLTNGGVCTAYDLATLNPKEAKRLGGVPLERIVYELQGISCIPLEEAPPPKKQIICSRSFGEKITNLEGILQAVSTFASRATEKIRAQDAKAGSMTVWIYSKQAGPSHHPRAQSESTLILNGTDDARRLSGLAVDIARRLYRRGAVYVKAGVGLQDIRPRDQWQEDMWVGSEAPGAMGIVDKINSRYGRNGIVLGRGVGVQSFAMKQEMMSKRYLTRWQEIPEVHC